MATGAAQITEVNFSITKCIEWQWTADASGNVNGIPTVNSYDNLAVELATKPGVGDSAYSIAIVDNNGLDVLCGQGTARSTSATQYLTSGLGAAAKSTLTLEISGAGAGATGTAWLYLR